MRNNSTYALLLLAVGLFACPSFATEVFQWTDDDGVIHFSQWMPAHTRDVRTLVLASQSAEEYDPNDDPYSIRNQARRMSDTWSKLEQRKEDRRKRRDEAAERAARQPPTYYYPAYPYYDRYYRPVVRPPIYRPGLPYVKPGHRRQVQHFQVAALRKHNARSNLRTPYSSVTGVSQRATIQAFPGIPRRNP